MRKKVLAALAVLVFISVSVFGTVSGKAEASKENRFNVVFVIDNSGSMSVTDGPNYRFEAVQQFIGLLPETGNRIGGVLFAPEAYNPQLLKELNTTADRNAFVKAMKNPGLRDGGTNIGAALAAAHNLLSESADPEIPSVIVLLSDGNTELKKDKMEESLQMQAEAVQKAVDDGVPVYAICLNVPNSAIKADPTEMENIATATGGAFREVSKSEDLGDVFRMFYDLIYGTNAIEIANTTMPESGDLSIPFDVPSFGVDEVNLVVYGKTSGLSIQNPANQPVDADINAQSTFSIVKIKNVTPGQWTLKAQGTNGEPLRVNMVLNSNVTIAPDVRTEEGETMSLAEMIPISDDLFRVVAPLRLNGTEASGTKAYESYGATLTVENAVTGETVKTFDMTAGAAGFEKALSLRDVTDTPGAFRLTVTLTGYCTDYANNSRVRFLEKKGTVSDTLKACEEVKPNASPVAETEELSYTISVWPFKGGKFELDLNTLATDPDGDELFYNISAPFPEGTDYTVSEDRILTQNHFSFRSGTYKIVISDLFGASCTVQVKVTAVNIALVTVLGLLAAGIVVLAILGVLLFIALRKPFYGEFEVYMLINGSQTDIKKIKPRRGRLKLKNLKVPMLSRKLDYNKSYFQAEGRGKRYVTLVTNYPVSCNGPASKSNRFESDVQKTVVVDGNQSLVLYVKFKSRQRLRRGGARGTSRPKGRPTGNRR